MHAKYPLPTVGYIFRSLVTAAGYRSYLIGNRQSLGKDLDDLANETRRNSVAEVLQRLEDDASEMLAEDCGNEWAQLFRLSWFRFRGAFRALILQADTSTFSDGERQEAFFRCFFSPLAAGFLRVSQDKFPGLQMVDWWSSPFRSWLDLATSKFCGRSEGFRRERFADHMSGNQRTLDRWMAGYPIEKLVPPYASVIKKAAQKAGLAIRQSGIFIFLPGGCWWQLLSSLCRRQRATP